jgi:transposase
MPLRVVTDEERQAVTRLAHARARVVLAALEGRLIEDIAAELRRSRNTVYLWLHRFEERGVAGLDDRGRSGRPRTYPGEQVGEIVATALTAQGVGPALRLLDAGPIGRLSGRTQGHCHEA